MTEGKGTAVASATPAEAKQQRQATGRKVEAAASKKTGKEHLVAVPNWGGPQQTGGRIAVNGDPFINGAAKDGAKLSGKAVSFAPGPMSYLNDRSEADAAPVICSPNPDLCTKKRTTQPAKTVQLPVGTPGVKTTPKRPRVVFTTDVGPHVTVPGGHYMMIENMAAVDYDAVMERLCDDLGWKDKLIGYVVPLPVGHSPRVTVWLCFDDIREAVNAIDEVEMVNPAYQAVYITQPEYAFGTQAGAGRGIKATTSFYDGQVTFTALWKGQDFEVDADGLYEYVQGTAKSIGDIVAVAETTIDPNVRQFRVEFMKINDAKYVADTITEQDPGTFKDWEVTARELPDLNTNVTPKHGITPQGTPQKLVKGMTLEYASPTGRTAWTYDQSGRVLPLPGHRQLPKLQSIKEGVALTPSTRGMRESDQSPHTPVSYIPGVTYTPHSGSWMQTPPTGPTPSTGQRTNPHRRPQIGPNRIDRHRILEGIDVRTTVMARNIPNEMSFEQFKGVVDSVCFGRYDFIYLRIDFAMNQNVGYAFVNFLNPEDMLRFVDRFDGKEYIKGMGRGRRRGEFAYATNQGQHNVISKFRNSAIMCEYPGYRPKLFWSEEDAPQEDYIGVERVFPGVDNMSKHNRSKDNAAHIGLYAPKNRRGAVTVRSSQYDRGTPAQMQEDAYYHHQQQMVPNQYPWEFNEPNYLLAGQHMAPMPFYHSPSAMNGSPLAYPPMTAYNGSPGPMTNNHGLQPSRLRTITQGRLGASRRRPITVHPGRDYETAIRQIEEGKREIAEYEAAMAARDAQEAAEAASYAQAANVPRFPGDEDTANGRISYHDGYIPGQYMNSINGTQYANGIQFANGDQNAHGNQNANGEYANGEYGNGQFANGYGGYQ